MLTAIKNQIKSILNTSSFHNWYHTGAVWRRGGIRTKVWDVSPMSVLYQPKKVCLKTIKFQASCNGLCYYIKKGLGRLLWVYKSIHIPQTYQSTKKVLNTNSFFKFKIFDKIQMTNGNWMWRKIKVILMMNNLEIW